MRVEVVFDKNTENNGLYTGWGVSFLIDNKVLFDTGERGSWLAKNLQHLGIDANDIESVVISHDHWDHTGGLWDLLKAKKNLSVYACPGFSREFKKQVGVLGGNLKETQSVTQVGRNMFTTGEIAGTYKGAYMPEQALVIKTANGLTIATGCAHPGIVRMVEKVKIAFPEETIYLIFGGFHLMQSDKRQIRLIIGKFKELGARRVGPTHCSGYEAEALFKQEYKDAFIPIKVGEGFEV